MGKEVSAAQGAVAQLLWQKSRVFEPEGAVIYWPNRAGNERCLGMRN
jgi:hypothetical protein